MGHNAETCPKCNGDWPFCEACQSYHSPCNPTCRAKKVDLSASNEEIEKLFARYDQMVLDGRAPKAVLASMFADLKTFVVVTDEPDQIMNLCTAYFQKTYKLATRAFPSVDPKWADIKPIEEMDQ
jgi:hypothetical protein